MKEQSKQRSSVDGMCGKELDIDSETTDKYISSKLNKFFKLTGKFDPAMKDNLAKAIEKIINNVYHDGFADAHLPVNNHCTVCGSYMPSEEESVSNPPNNC